MPESKQEIISFENTQIRRLWHEDKWYFSVVDVVAVLTESPEPRKYWNKVKKKEFVDIQLSPVWRQLKLTSSDGKKYDTDCATVDGLFRIIQAVPSKKAEPIKLWLAQIGRERLEEVQNPELAMERMRQIYEKQGYSKEWIALRERSIGVRNSLTGEWKDRGADQSSYGLLTALIAKGTFGVTPSEHKAIKKLKEHNLRDHMTDIELILTMLGEATATKIHKDRDSKGLEKLSIDTAEAGRIAGNTRKEIEKSTGKPVVTDSNYLSLTGEEE